MPEQFRLFGGSEPVKSRGDGVERDALLSPCGTWRWWLLRIWNRSKPLGLVCMINPSTADDTKDDSTVQSLMRRARHWGLGGFYVVNLCAFRSPHPNDLLTAKDPIGPECDRWIAELARKVAGGGALLAAWGSSVDFGPETRPVLRGRDTKVKAALSAIGDLWCIGRSGPGGSHPTHPLARGKHRVPDDALLRLFAPGPEGGAIPTEKKVYSVHDVPPHPDHMPPLGAAPRGPCAWCGTESEGRYSVLPRPKDGVHGPPMPLCNRDGMGYHPTVAEIRAKEES